MKSKWNLNSFTWANEERLPGFGKLLSSWLDVHRTFCEGAQPNFSWEWGHNEHSQLGLLADAGTLIGGISIRESWIRKDSGQREGRSDLWLRLCPPDSENDYLIEAKIEQYLNVVELDKANKTIIKKMEVVCKNAQSLAGNPGKFVAMTFLSLRFADENLDSLEKKTSDLISHIWNQSQSKKGLDAIGAIWMGAKDLQRSQEERKKNNETNVHFGMILLASRMMIE
jgi:hypothetical protein